MLGERPIRADSGLPSPSSVLDPEASDGVDGGWISGPGLTGLNPSATIPMAANSGSSSALMTDIRSEFLVDNLLSSSSVLFGGRSMVSGSVSR